MHPIPRGCLHVMRDDHLCCVVTEQVLIQAGVVLRQLEACCAAMGLGIHWAQSHLASDGEGVWDEAARADPKGSSDLLREHHTLPDQHLLPRALQFVPVYFKPGGGKHFNVTFGRSVALHFWNKMSKNKTVKVNSNSVYEVAAKRFCPITYRTATTHSNVF
ncbi:hypothetical protein GWK47_037854 [Chionoecetes opilio]|uniref:Alpha 1,4-glycosyltransferase domain-containing protein n=1 Tax=Chionoecetes opilio TaxID=41210 RepID=A0A8J4YLE0_CHIOP|nr:hypothetical protein GWK47_037854 [Chionoecetes opilio]